MVGRLVGRFSRYHPKRIFVLLAVACIGLYAWTSLGSSLPASPTFPPASSPYAQNALREQTSPSASKSCPNPLANRPTLQNDDFAADLSRCYPLPSNNPELNLYICPTSHRLPCNSFSIVVQRVADLDACAGHPWSRKKDYSARMIKDYGPDSFTVFVDGTERFAIEKAIVGHCCSTANNPNDLEQYSSKTPCRYTYPVVLVNGGPWNLQIYHGYEKWRHLDELPFAGATSSHDEDYPAMLDQPLLPQGGIPSAQLPNFSRCSDGCKEWRFPPSPEAGGPTGSVRVLDAAVHSLPICPKGDPIYGAYLPDETPVQNMSLPILPFRWHPLGCKLSPVNLKMLDGAAGEDARQKCLAKKRTVVFQGDSHTRMSYDALTPRFKGLGTDAPVYSKAKNKTGSYYGLTLDFQWDSHLIRMQRSKVAPEADALVLSVGAHQCRNRWTTDQFQAYLARIMALIKGWSAQPAILQISLPAKTPYAEEFRTHSRVGLWNQLTLKEVESSQAQLPALMAMDGFESTLPFVRESPDKIVSPVVPAQDKFDWLQHFRDTPAQEGWLMQILHKLDLCEAMP